MSQKVLFVSSRSFMPEYYDGINKILFNLLKNNDFYTSGFISPDIKKESTVGSEFEHVKIHEPSVELKRLNPYVKRLKWLFSNRSILEIDCDFLRGLSKEIENLSEKYDVICLSSITVGAAIPYLSKQTQAKVILCPADSWSLYWNRYIKIEKNFIKRMFWNFEESKSLTLENKLYSCARAVVLVSEIDRKFVKREILDTEKISVISNGVRSYKNEREARTSQTKKIVFLGNYNHPPNRQAAKFIVHNILPKLNLENFKVDLIGLNPSPDIIALGSKYVTVTGFVEDIELSLNASDVFVCPMFSGAGIKNKVLESMSMGLPVVGSPMAFEALAGEKGRHFIEVDSINPEDWRDAIENLFNSQDSISKMTSEAKTLVESQYSWNSVRNSYAEIFKKI